MRLSILAAGFLTIFASSQALAIEAAKGSPVGSVMRVRGEASADSGSGPRVLTEHASVELGDRLRTGDGARLEIKLLDGTDVTLGEKADFTLDQFALSDTSGAALFTRTAGALKLLAGQIAQKQQHKLEVASNVATIGIRGTEFWGGTIKAGSQLDVFLLEGAVEVRSAAGTVVLDKAGQGTSVAARDRAPETPDFWQPALRERALATVSFDSR